MKTARKIELLAPAKNAEIGIAAIDHGADAVYIGVQGFSARSMAGNSVEEIKRLIDYAHTFHAKVYVALNTIIMDSELIAVERLIGDLYRINADAVIIQDMGILEMNLPPIPLHASTQMDNRDLSKVKLLEELGFSQIVLARELSLSGIQEIASQTDTPIEVFVHGALCTSYSGQCYISQALSKRSANRGECAQYCRLPYTLSDASGKILASNKHLLSLKDLNLSNHLEELLDAGVSSLKIEGRLKDMSYVKNITAYYRRRLDEIFERRPEYIPASSGKSTPFFLPNPEKSFNRGFTTYFFHGRNKQMTSVDSPKSLGEPVGNVKDISARYFTIQGGKHISIHNGDGLCFINNRKEMEGFRVNKVEQDKIFPAEMPRFDRGVALYRNYDQQFEKELAKKSAERKINLELTLSENNFGYTLSAVDEDLLETSISMECPKESANKDQRENMQQQLSKLGNTPFSASGIHINLNDSRFIPSSVLGEMRRKLVEALLIVRQIRHPHQQMPKKRAYKNLRIGQLTYLANIANEKAKQTYAKLGVTKLAPAFEINPLKGVPLMFAKYCIRYQMGVCTKGKDNSSFTLTSGNNKLNLRFDCDSCQMIISEQGLI